MAAISEASPTLRRPEQPVVSAGLVGLTPSGVTRALRRLEEFGYVATIKNERDARLALAAAGGESVDDASSVIDDAMASVLEHEPI